MDAKGKIVKDAACTIKGGTLRSVPSHTNQNQSDKYYYVAVKVTSLG